MVENIQKVQNDQKQQTVEKTLKPEWTNPFTTCHGKARAGCISNQLNIMQCSSSQHSEIKRL